MNSVIKDILKRKVNIEDKRNALNSLEKDIEIAKKILSGEMIYCENCDDYFLVRSFFQDTETKRESICIYSDPINSSGDEYADRDVLYTYLICPKGHKHLIDRKEL